MLKFLSYNKMLLFCVFITVMFGWLSDVAAKTGYETCNIIFGGLSLMFGFTSLIMALANAD